MATIHTTKELDGMGVLAAITALITAKAVTNWSTARKVAGINLHRPYASADCGLIIKAFEAVMAGSSSLITDANGQFATCAATAGHVAWLTAQGYEGDQLPTYKEKAAPKAKGSKGSSAVTAIVAELMKGMAPADKAAFIMALITKE